MPHLFTMEQIMDEWTEARLQRYIDDQVQEHSQLDYKAAAALNKDPKRNENITKDVSAFANSAGGMIIYGIKEDKNVPVSLDPVDISQATRETLDQIIGTIQPKIEDVMIYPVTINNDPTKQIYVVQIPQSTTAHQARDRKYYKRLNTTSEAMQDYEIRDVMNRSKYPNLELLFEMCDHVDLTYVHLLASTEEIPVFNLRVHAKNTGSVYAKYIDAFVLLPFELIAISDFDNPTLVERDGKQYVEYNLVNLNNQSQYLPLLPGLTQQLDTLEMRADSGSDLKNEYIYWTVHADNAPPIDGKTLMSEIPVLKC